MTIDIDAYRREHGSLAFSVLDDAILGVIIAQQDRHNAVDESMQRDLATVRRRIDVDESVNAVLVRGAGKHFCAGGDFTMIEKMIADERMLIRVWKQASDLVYNLVNCSKPVVSAIRGSAVGAGLAVALLADVSVAAHDAKILDGHTRLVGGDPDEGAHLRPVGGGRRSPSATVGTCRARLVSSRCHRCIWVACSLSTLDAIKKASSSRPSTRHSRSSGVS